MIPGFPFQPVCGRGVLAGRDEKRRVQSWVWPDLLPAGGPPWGRVDRDLSITLPSHFDDRKERATLSEAVWVVARAGHAAPSGEAAGREKEFFSPLHRILNSFYLNGKCLQLNLDSYQLVHKTQGKKALMMEKNQTVWWPGAKFYVEKSGGQKKTSWNVEALISWKKQGLGSRQDVTSEQTLELVDAHLITNETSILRRHCWEADIWPAHSTMHSIWIKYCWLDTNFQIKGHS